jgi:phosphatidylglycerophosphate synthase
LGDPINSVRSILYGILIFAFIVLDNLDGKQARRTKTSSALGMLFDHGCDSLSMFFLACCLFRFGGV